MSWNRFFTAVFLVVFVSCLSFTPLLQAKEPESPAEFFPPHTYMYLQVNPVSTFMGFENLKLARLLEDPTLKRLFDQTMASIPPQADPLAMYAMYGLDEVLEDCIAIGIPGFFSRKPGAAGSPPTVRRYPSDGPVPTSAFNSGQFGGDGLVAIKVTDRDRFYEIVREILGDFVYDGIAPAPKKEVVDGIEIHTWKISGENAYTAFAEGYVLLSPFKDNILNAIARQKSKTFSLNTRSDFRQFRKHMGKKSAAGFLHISVQDLLELFKPFLPAGELDEMAIWGALDYSSIQMGLGFHDGGICEWLHVAFAENPRGIFLNLARLWPSANLIEARTDRGLVYGASLTFDWAALYNVVMLTLDLCDVDTASFTREFKANLGLDLRDDIFGALGNRIGGLVVIPNHGFIPETSLVLSIRNREKMEKILSRLSEIYEQMGLKSKQFTVPGGGPKATYVDFAQEIPVKPAYVVQGDDLVISSMPLTLKYAVMKSSRTGKSIVDLLPSGTVTSDDPLFSLFMDPGPTAMDLYADLLKIMDSGKGAFPVQATDLPSPEFIAQCLSKFGIEFSADAYYMAIDLHSPAGIVLPLMIGAVIGQRMDQANRSNI